MDPVSEDAMRQQRLDTFYARAQRAYFYDVANVSVETLLQWRRTHENHPLVLVDVREEAEIRVSRIPGALSVTEFERRKREFRSNMCRVVTYCTVGLRSGVYARKLKAEGYSVWNLAGSILAYAHATGSLETEEGYKTIWKVEAAMGQYAVLPYNDVVACIRTHPNFSREFRLFFLSREPQLMQFVRVVLRLAAHECVTKPLARSPKFQEFVRQSNERFHYVAQQATQARRDFQRSPAYRDLGIMLNKVLRAQRGMGEVVRQVTKRLRP